MNPEWIGVPAAVLVLLSYLFSNQLKLRILNIVASLVFVAYGLAIAATTGWTAGWSTVVLNALCVVVHIRWLIIYKKQKKNAELPPEQADLSQTDENSEDDYFSN